MINRFINNLEETILGTDKIIRLLVLFTVN